VLIKCVDNVGSNIGPYRGGLYYTEETRFDVVVGQTYVVYAMALINDGLTVLVADTYDKPAWLPVELFVVEDPRLPGHWEFALGQRGDAGRSPGQLIWRGKWGYSELVRSDAHYYGLEDRDAEALRIFYEERDRYVDDAVRQPGIE
jgi:hypothetical protein